MSKPDTLNQYDHIVKLEIYGDCIPTIPCVHHIRITREFDTHETMLKSGEIIYEMICEITSDGKRQASWIRDQVNEKEPWMTREPLEHFVKYHHFSPQEYHKKQQQEYIEIVEEYEKINNPSNYLTEYPQQIKNCCSLL